MKLVDLVQASQRIAATRSRLEKAGILATLLGKANLEEVPLIVSYLSGAIPQGRVGIGHATLEPLRGVLAAGRPEIELGDVHKAFEELVSLAGSGSSRQRGELLRELYRKATGAEQEFIGRLLVGELRHGSLEGIMIEAVAKATELPPADVRRALMLSADLGLVARTLMAQGAAGVEEFELELLRPVQPMLAQTAADVDEALATLGTAALEVKLDGARIQVHKRGDEVRVYTRRLNDVSHACPEVVESVRALDVDSVILDGEVIALKKDARPYPFQVTMRRFGRRLDVDAMRKALPLTSVYFDCLYLDGESLLDIEAQQRFGKLCGVLPEELVVRRIVTRESHEARQFVDETLAAGHEGVMAKALHAPYEAGARGKAWLKVKAAQTLDLVVLAAEWGSGRRKGWLSNLHLGALDASTGRFVMLGKTFKGMTDEILEWQTKRLQEIETKRDERTVYVRAELVVEIAFNDLQKSPHYPGGLALRFARLKGYRDDKRPEDADTIATVRALYQKHTGELPDEGERQLSLFG
jgi:DNA ligase-1